MEHGDLNGYCAEICRAKGRGRMKNVYFYPVSASTRLIGSCIIAILIAAAAFPAIAFSANGRQKLVTFYEKDREMACSFKAELAITPEEQSRGLMFRAFL